jgi:hypothetical protein
MMEVVLRDRSVREVEMARNVGDRFVCRTCGAQIVYEKPCPCPEGKPHAEICCGVPMTPLPDQSAAPVGSAS